MGGPGQVASGPRLFYSLNYSYIHKKRACHLPEQMHARYTNSNTLFCIGAMS
jgi:hypothetical protein